MINLRYHIVSLTAVFLAIGIGLAFGSSFLDQATVDNLQGQLDNLRNGLADRDERISALEDELDLSHERAEALDAEGGPLLAGLADGVPVLVLAASGADEGDVTGLIESLAGSGADVAGTWWVTDRFLLDDDSEVNDLAEAVGGISTRPSTLRREAIAAITRVVDLQQAIDIEVDETDETDEDAGVEGEADPGGEDGPAGGVDVGDTEAAEPGEDAAVIAELFARGFLEFDAIAGGLEQPVIPDGVRVVVVGGSESVPDDVVLVPVTSALRDGPAGAALVAATSAASDEGRMSPLVGVIREDGELRELVSTVDTIEHFTGRAAVVMTVANLGSGAVGHYGMGEGSARLLPEQVER